MNRFRLDTGQSLVEFSLAIIVFLVILMGVVDFGMAIYRYNGVSEAAREIARVTSVHPCVDPLALTCPPGEPASVETQAVIDIQKALIPSLVVTDFVCVDNSGVVVSNPCDFSKHSVQVTVESAYSPVTPLLGLTGIWTMKGSSSAQLH
ncbi:MAG: TadE/TadG family type IV pilus assembly protein [Candidatus Limnocylindrales bacterium]